MPCLEMGATRKSSSLPYAFERVRVGSKIFDTSIMAFQISAGWGCQQVKTGMLLKIFLRI